jgi:hypothetical protein
MVKNYLGKKIVLGVGILGLAGSLAYGEGLNNYSVATETISSKDSLETKVSEQVSNNLPELYSIENNNLYKIVNTEHKVLFFNIHGKDAQRIDESELEEISENYTELKYSKRTKESLEKISEIKDYNIDLRLYVPSKFNNKTNKGDLAKIYQAYDVNSDNLYKVLSSNTKMVDELKEKGVRLSTMYSDLLGNDYMMSIDEFMSEYTNKNRETSVKTPIYSTPIDSDNTDDYIHAPGNSSNPGDIVEDPNTGIIIGGGGA